MPRLILAADIGGTKSLFGLFEDSPRGLINHHRQRLVSAQHPDLASLLRAYLQAAGQPEVAAVALAIAAPVQGSDGHQFGRVTNLPWNFDNLALSAELRIAPLAIVNDFAAIGYALDDLRDDERLALQTGEPRGDLRLVVGAGTGLGCAMVLGQGAELRVLPTEAGHMDFAPRDAHESALRDWLQQRLGLDHLSIERLVAGSGIEALYRFLCDRRGLAADPEVEAARAVGKDPVPVIAGLGLSGASPLAADALRHFVGLYGATTGNLALTCLPRGGVYIAGGVGARLQPVMTSGAFINAFQAKGRLRPLLESLPVQLITAEDLGLRGAARLAAQLARRLAHR